MLFLADLSSIPFLGWNEVRHFWPATFFSKNKFSAASLEAMDTSATGILENTFHSSQHSSTIGPHACMVSDNQKPETVHN